MKVYNLENIKSVTELKHRTEAISMNERSIIVLDTFTGIAQKLQAVSISLFHLDIEKVMNQLQDFENDCGNWLDNLLSSEMQKAEAAKEIKVHIDQISRLCNENPNIIDDHEIMAHGAMISSLILSHYLEECTKKNFILNSCHFMRLGLDRKPDIKYVKKNVEELMKDCPDVPILITQSRVRHAGPDRCVGRDGGGSACGQGHAIRCKHSGRPAGREGPLRCRGSRAG